MIEEKLIALGFDNAKEIDTAKIVFEPTLRRLCEMNSCGNYKKSYTCPPYVGETDALISEIKNYTKAVVFQKIYRLSDSFDIEGMENGNRDFRLLSEKADDEAKKVLDCYKLLSAGGCRKCAVCGVTDGIPCRFPKKAFASLESYCIQVSELARASDMKYINGANTVTYFGAVFYKQT